MVIGSYLAYLGISIAVTVWVARTLHRNGRIFLKIFSSMRRRAARPAGV